jgi:glutaredoxin 3
MRLELYHLQTCPYCAKVRAFIEAHGLKDAITYYEVSSDPEAVERLVQLTGQTGVPVLVIDGEPLIGSDQIIEWLAENEEDIKAEMAAGSRGDTPRSRQERRL